MTESLPTNDVRFRQIQDYIDRMPSLSTTVTKVLEVCNRPNTSPNDLNRVISLDPVLTGQVLKLINSAYYSLPNQITSLTRAIIMLGLNTVKNLALSTAVLGAFKSDAFQALSMDGFWAHSICVGVTVKTLAAKLEIPVAMREEYFVAGLLHDLGKIPLNNCFSEEYSRILNLAVLEQGPLKRAEEMMLGFDHGQVGGMIAGKWQLNEAITDVLSDHHTPENITGERSQMVMMTSLANVYANINQFGTAGDQYQDESQLSWLLESLGLKWSDLQAMEGTVRAEIEKAQIFLQISEEAW
ncbi:MAG: HDOD domain-containing protein [Proteobacteria bacterium]|nr:HDOD domain-containing protein [Pseudomonadota bacterium]MBU1736886.1 HDOD domain-containing protein [Pseudomonadota bacterium]